IIKTYGLNEEQARAFSIVAGHSLQDQPLKALRMHLGGPGGTGKSRVIGVAARNISGMTLHSALMLGDHYGTALSSKSKRDLMAMWDGVDYLFIDEISMVGCPFLHDISHQL
ncbi:hypothetical protein B0H16DRAFT_1238173, partial [Mycena metata]